MILPSTASRPHRVRPFFLHGALLCLALSLPPAAARAQAIVLGDSIGVGVSAAARLPRLARPSVSLRGDAIFEQLQRTPRGATAFLALGTNDTFDSPRMISAQVDRILAAARSADLRLVWIGPPCVRKPWNHRAQALDSLLRTQLSGRAPFVSAIDPSFCDARIKAPDGVHFTMRGYRLLWDRARSVETASGHSIVPRTMLRAGVEGADRD